MGKATQELKKEHDIILGVLKFLDKMISEDAIEDKVRHYDEMVYFLKIFADICHHRKEEFLFRELCQRDTFSEKELIATLLQEHELDRRYITYMSESLESRDYEGYGNAAIKYCNLVKRHIAKENNIVFILADQLLEEIIQNALLETFEKYEKSVMGEGVHHELNAMIAAWTKELQLE